MKLTSVMTKLSGVIIVGLFLAVTTFAQATNKGDDGNNGNHSERCDLRTLRGAYGYLISGGVNDSSDPTFHTHVFFAGLGRVVFDGRGNHSGTEIVNLASHFIDRVYTGTYTVNPDCTGILRRTEVPLSNTIVRFVIVDGGKQVFFMQVDNADPAINGMAVKQD
jgi:hypothetical protein